MTTHRSKHLETFERSHLAPGEAVLVALDGFIGKFLGKGPDEQLNGVLVLTTGRVAFYRKGLVREVLRTVPRGDITGMEQSGMLGGQTLTVRSSGGEIRFTTFRAGRLSLLRELLTDGSQGPIDPARIAAADSSDQREQARRGKVFIGAIVAVAVVVLILAFGSKAEKKPEAKKQASNTAWPSEAAKEAMAARQAGDSGAGRGECVIGVPGRKDAVPAYRTREKFEESYELARAGATGRELLLHLVGDGGKQIDPGTKCSYADLGLMSSTVIVTEGSFRMQKFILPTDWTHYSRE